MNLDIEFNVTLKAVQYPQHNVANAPSLKLLRPTV